MVTEKGKAGQVHKMLEGEAGPKHAGLGRLLQSLVRCCWRVGGGGLIIRFVFSEDVFACSVMNWRETRLKKRDQGRRMLQSPRWQKSSWDWDINKAVGGKGEWRNSWQTWRCGGWFYWTLAERIKWPCNVRNLWVVSCTFWVCKHWTTREEHFSCNSRIAASSPASGLADLPIQGHPGRWGAQLGGAPCRNVKVPANQSAHYNITAPVLWGQLPKPSIPFPLDITQKISFFLF